MLIKQIFSILFILCTSIICASQLPTHFLSDYTRGGLSAIAISGMQGPNSPAQEIVIFSDSNDAVESLSQQHVRFTLTKNDTNGLWDLHYKEDNKIIASLDNFNGDFKDVDGLYYFLNKSLSEDFRDKFYQSMKVGQSGCLLQLAQSVERNSSTIVFEGASNMSFWKASHAGGSKTKEDKFQLSHFPSTECPDGIYNQILAQKKIKSVTSIGSNVGENSSHLITFSGLVCGFTFFALLLLFLHHKGLISYNFA